MDAVFGLKDALTQLKEAEIPSGILAREDFLIQAMKKLFLLAAGNAAQTFNEKLTEEQEILCRLADIAMEIFAAESGLLRAKKILAEKGEEAARLPILMTEAFVNDMVPKLEAWAKEIIAGIAEGEAAGKMYAGLKVITSHYQPINGYSRKRQIADAVYEVKRYPLDRR